MTNLPQVEVVLSQISSTSESPARFDEPMTFLAVRCSFTVLWETHRWLGRTTGFLYVNSSL